MDLLADGLVEEAQLLVQVVAAVDVLRFLQILLVRKFTFQPQRDVLLLARLHVAELHRALEFHVGPERAVVVEVRLVEAEVVVGQQALESRVDFHVVVEVDGVDVTAAVIDCSLQLSFANKRNINDNIIAVAQETKLRITRLHVENEFCCCL